MTWANPTLTELIALLRQGDPYGDHANDRCCCVVMGEAADALEQMMAESDDE